MHKNLQLKFQIQIELWVRVPVTIRVEWDLQFHVLSSEAEAPIYIIVLFSIGLDHGTTDTCDQNHRKY